MCPCTVQNKNKDGLLQYLTTNCLHNCVTQVWLTFSRIRCSSFTLTTRTGLVLWKLYFFYQQIMQMTGYTTELHSHSTWPGTRGPPCTTAHKCFFLRPFTIIMSLSETWNHSFLYSTLVSNCCPCFSFIVASFAMLKTFQLLSEQKDTICNGYIAIIKWTITQSLGFCLW